MNKSRVKIVAILDKYDTAFAKNLRKGLWGFGISRSSKAEFPLCLCVSKESWQKDDWTVRIHFCEVHSFLSLALGEAVGEG
jgi:hypothetical protein